MQTVDSAQPQSRKNLTHMTWNNRLASGNPPLIIAHRGLSERYPENTHRALHAAVDAGCEAIELDVRFSLDAVPFVMHDNRLSRTSTGRGYLHRKSSEDLSLLDVGIWRGEEHRGQAIPLVTEVIERYVAQTLINLEVKRMHTGLRLLLDWCCSRPEWRGRILVSSFDWSILHEVASRRTHTPPVALLSREVPGRRRLQRAQAMQPLSCNVSVKQLDPEAVKAVRDLGIPLLCYTVNDADTARRLFDLGFSGIFSDRASELREELGGT